jgi:hypothetical protein
MWLQAYNKEADMMAHLEYDARNHLPFIFRLSACLQEANLLAVNHHSFPKLCSKSFFGRQWAINRACTMAFRRFCIQAIGKLAGRHRSAETWTCQLKFDFDQHLRGVTGALQLRLIWTWSCSKL